MSEENPDERRGGRRGSLRFIVLVAVVVMATVLGLALLINIFSANRKREILSSKSSSSPTTLSIRASGAKTFRFNTTTT
jgi:flagellar basal body-associated protein FliL